jgi:hypothetical protein
VILTTISGEPDPRGKADGGVNSRANHNGAPQSGQGYAPRPVTLVHGVAQGETYD